MVKTSRTGSNEKETADEPTLKRSKRSDDVDEPALDASAKVLSRHVTAAKFFIISGFQSSRDPLTLWKLLTGTVWQEDPDICAQALFWGMPVSTIKGHKILKDPELFCRLLTGAENAEQVQKLWVLGDARVRLDPECAFVAMKCGVSLGLIDKTITGNSELPKDAITKGSIEWKYLPIEFRRDVDFALCARQHGRASEFQNVVSVVDDKERLWREWACEDPDNLHLELWRDAPDTIRLDPAIMLKTVIHDADVIPYVHPSLLQNEEFLKSVLDHKIEALCLLPTDTFERFPWLLGVDVMKRFFALPRLKVFLRQKNLQNNLLYQNGAGTIAILSSRVIWLLAPT